MSYDSPAVILYDGYGNPVLIDGYHVSVYPKGVGIGGYYPNVSLSYPTIASGEKAPLTIEENGGLVTRGPVFTDEGSYFDDFDYGTLESSWFVYNLGGSYSVTNSLLIVSAGLTPGSLIAIGRDADTLPLSVSFKMRIINADINNVISVGFQTPTEPYKRAVITFDGSNPKLLKFGNFASETVYKFTDIKTKETFSSADYHVYTVEVGNGYTAAYIDGERVFHGTEKCLGPYDDLRIGIFLTNVGPVSRLTYLYVDSVTLNNTNVVEITNTFKGDPISVDIQKDTQIIIKGPKETDGDINVEHEGEAVTRLFTSDSEIVSTLGQILNVLKRIETHFEAMNEFEVDNGDIDE